ncbi:unnamed protein product [Lactuca saligna]|uniref:Uncharacterized protein n=1 Tax=Lactuca saligna TaxID=75948 RepID=A0AA35V0T5_LACSI|nr:unnamed protein product [Lactuca saligna]
MWISCSSCKMGCGLLVMGLFRMHELVYEELCVEFFSIVNFRKKDDVTNPENFTFCLGGQRRQIHLCEFTWRLDIYNCSDALSLEFVFFLEHYHKRLPEGITKSAYWTEIPNGLYIIGSAPKKKIRKVVHRFIHRSITFSNNQKMEGDWVLKLDVFFLWCIITPNNLCHLP